MAAPVYESPNGRVQRVATDPDEAEYLESQGYKKVRRNSSTTDREPLNSGAEGQRRARQSSTTEGSERNSGSSARG